MHLMCFGIAIGPIQERGRRPYGSNTAVNIRTTTGLQLQLKDNNHGKLAVQHVRCIAQNRSVDGSLEFRMAEIDRILAATTPHEILGLQRSERDHSVQDVCTASCRVGCKLDSKGIRRMSTMKGLRTVLSAFFTGPILNILMSAKSVRQLASPYRTGNRLSDPLIFARPSASTPTSATTREPLRLFSGWRGRARSISSAPSS